MSAKSLPLQIFKVGTWTDNGGTTAAFSDAELAATAAAYDPINKHEAPLVVGHPTLDAPAYGWVQALAVIQDALEATPKQVDTEFADMVREGRFNKISSSFWRPDAPGNPVPGVYYLRHVGFLGAAAPAVKGLRPPILFAANETGVVELSADFSEWSSRTQLDLWRGLREWLLTQFGAETADRVVSGYALDSLQSDLEQSAVESAVESVSPSSPQDSLSMSDATDLAAREAALSARETAIAAQEQQLQAQAAAQRRREVTAFAEVQVKAGKVLPRQKLRLIELLLAQPDTTLEFADAGDIVKIKPQSLLEEFVSDLPVQVDYAERTGGAGVIPPGNAGPDQQTAEFAVNQDLQAEFGTVERYLAYQKSEADGRAKIHGETR